jgi:uncharacterized damage-inducible protein DinB
MHGYGSADLAAAFRTVRKNTLLIAEDIPEDKYAFVAVPGVRSVRDMLSHIAFASMIQEDMHRVNRITTLKGYDFGAIVGRAAAAEKKPQTKAEVIATLKTEGEKFAGWLESLTPEFLAETFTDPTGEIKRTRFESLLGVKEHEMHHRAQLMLIERMVGIVPHLTREREARVRQRPTATPAGR